MKIYRHGDITLHSIKEAKGEKVKHDGSFILAYGEATGHNHTITVPSIDDMDLYRTTEGGIILTLRAEGRLTHQEHKELIIPAGTYKINREREADHFQDSVVRRVVD